LDGRAGVAGFDGGGVVAACFDGWKELSELLRGTTISFYFREAH